MLVLAEPVVDTFAALKVLRGVWVLAEVVLIRPTVAQVLEEGLVGMVEMIEMFALVTAEVAKRVELEMSASRPVENPQWSWLRSDYRVLVRMERMALVKMGRIHLACFQWKKLIVKYSIARDSI